MVAGCALVGGETAEHPGLLEPDEYDVAGAATGVVERDRILGPHRVRAGDVLVAMASSGLHSNGYSLVRRGDRLGRLGAGPGGARSWAAPSGAELLEPTRVYAADILDLIGADLDVHALSHVTGGGLAANLARVLPPGLLARVDRATWTPAPIFGLVGELGSGAARRPGAHPEHGRRHGRRRARRRRPTRVVDRLAERDLPAWVAGMVTPGRRPVGRGGTRAAPRVSTAERWSWMGAPAA